MAEGSSSWIKFITLQKWSYHFTSSIQPQTLIGIAEERR
jgi:hypothetical protein